MTVKLGDLVAGYHMGKYYLGQITRLNSIGICPVNGSRYPHAVTWFKHWFNAEYTPYNKYELQTLESFKKQFYQWEKRDFK
jgi:hypothetical protein